MKRRVFVVLIVAVMLAMLLPLATPTHSEAAAPQYTSYITYVVKHGDTLARLGRRYCTSWQSIYALNRNVIGPDPDHLVAGMVLTIPANCHGGGCGYVYDRGWLPHAQGSVIPPNHYWVIRGDTWYSIGKRFGVSVHALRRANGLYYPYANSVVVIPCLNAVYPTPPPLTPAPTPTPPVVVAPHLSIASPPVNAVLPQTFTVSGHGGNLPEANVVVRIKDQNGAEIAVQTTVLQGPDVGIGGEGDWSVQFTLASPPASGVIEASSPGTSAFASVHVYFQNSGNVDYPPGQCNINIKANASAYDTPNGRVLGIFPQAITLGAQRRERVNNEDWYKVSVFIDGVSTPVWTPMSDIDSVGPGC